MCAVDPHRVLQGNGRRIAEIRRESRQTQQAFAEGLEISVRYIQFVEGGKENLTVETLVKFANFLRVPVIELLTPLTKPKASPEGPKKKA